MSNNTAAQYKQIANEATARIASLTREIDELDRQRQQLQAQATQTLAETGNRTEEQQILAQQRLVVEQRNQLLAQRSEQANIARINNEAAQKAASNPADETNTRPVTDEPQSSPPFAPTDVATVPLQTRPVEVVTEAAAQQDVAAREAIDLASTRRTPQELTDDALQEARFEQERLNAVAAGIVRPINVESESQFEARIERERLDAAAPAAAREEQRERGGPSSGAPTITQGPPQGSGIPNVALDDDGNLLPGWVQGPDNTAAYVGTLVTSPEPQKTVVDDPTYGGTVQVFDDGSTIQTFDDGTVLARGTDGNTSALTTEGKVVGLTGGKSSAQSSAQTRTTQIKNQPDWRVRLQLAQRADYLYLSPQNPGIMQPLQATRGILFPYLPTVSVTYSAAYDNQALTHTNYRVLQYTGSSVDNIQVTADFTAQSTEEANYVLAVIHFLRTITKSFYGQDENPLAGTPPPLVYLTGYGEFQYSRHPLVITNFTYALPVDVDYIRADSQLVVPGTPSASEAKAPSTTKDAKKQRQESSKVPAGGHPLKPQWQRPVATDSVTYVPTKISLSFTGLPVVTRADMSREFSVRDYATGKLTAGTRRIQQRGIW